MKHYIISGIIALIAILMLVLIGQAEEDTTSLFMQIWILAYLFTLENQNKGK